MPKKPNPPESPSFTASSTSSEVDPQDLSKLSLMTESDSDSEASSHDRETKIRKEDADAYPTAPSIVCKETIATREAAVLDQTIATPKTGNADQLNSVNAPVVISTATDIVASTAQDIARAAAKVTVKPEDTTGKGTAGSKKITSAEETTTSSSCADSPVCYTENLTNKTKVYDIVPIKGKGLGMIACKDIKRGELIHMEAPLIRISRNEESVKMLKQFDNLSETQKRECRALHNCKPEINEVVGIFWTNAIPLKNTEEDFGESGLLLTASRINHSCRPNTYQSWDDKTGMAFIFAIRDIAVGQEITSFYMREIECFQNRQLHLQELLDFTCRCEVCSLPAEHRAISDQNIGEMKAIQAKLEVLGEDGDPAFVLPLIRKLIQLYEQEGLFGAEVIAAVKQAFSVCKNNLHGPRAMFFGARLLRLLREVEGPDSPRTKHCQEKLIETHVMMEISPAAQRNDDPQPDVALPDQWRDWVYMSGDYARAQEFR